MSRFAGQGSSLTIVERSGASRYASRNCCIRQRFCGEEPHLRLHGVDQGRRNVTSLVTNLAARIRFVTFDVANLWPPSCVGRLRPQFGRKSRPVDPPLESLSIGQGIDHRQARPPWKIAELRLGWHHGNESRGDSQWPDSAGARTRTPWPRSPCRAPLRHLDLPRSDPGAHPRGSHALNSSARCQAR